MLTPQPSDSTGSKSWKPLNSFLKDDAPLVEEKKYPNVNSLWPEWHKEANCLGLVDDVLFFGAPKGERVTTTVIVRAQDLCDHCPVFSECLRHALKQRETWGIWASTTIKQRQAIFDGLDTGLFTVEEIIQDRIDERDERNRVL